MLLNLLMSVAAILVFAVLGWMVNFKDYFGLCLRSFVFGTELLLTSLSYGYGCHMFEAYYGFSFLIFFIIGEIS